MNEERVHIQGEVSIGATIVYQDKLKQQPAVVLIMGTGKADRDGNEKKFHTNFYKTLSDQFAQMGCVCVRYDKRGTFETSGDYNTSGLSDLVKDAISVIQYTKELAYVDPSRVIVCGHSEGTMIGTLASEQELLAGLILLGGAGTSLKDALLYQNRLAVLEFEKKKGLLGWLVRMQLNKEKADQKVEKMFLKCIQSKKSRTFFSGTMLNTKWMTEHGSYTSRDFVNKLSQYNGRVLAITGTADLSADYQVLDDFQGMEHIICYAPENVNHILREVDDANSMMTAMKQYQRLSLNPIEPKVIEKIREWLETCVE